MLMRSDINYYNRADMLKARYNPSSAEKRLGFIGQDG
jgi:hypothetical protein